METGPSQKLIWERLLAAQEARSNIAAASSWREKRLAPRRKSFDAERRRRLLERRDANAVSGEAEDVAVLNVDGGTRKKPDAVDPGADTIDSQISKSHDIVRARLNHDRIGA
jgi:hypothetical protein